MLRCIVPPDSNHVTCKNKIQTFQISKYIVFKNKWWSNLHLIKYAFNKISYKDKRQMFFLHYIYVDIYTEISKQQLGRKYKALQGIVIKHFVFLCLSIAESNGKHLGKCIFQCSRRAQFQIFLTPQHPPWGHFGSH